MKFNAILFGFTLLATSNTASAFVLNFGRATFVTAHRPLQSQTSPTSEASENAVQAALAASKKYGPTSAEARVAWDVVEELSAARSHANEDIEVRTVKSAELRGYLEEFSASEEMKMKLARMKALAEEIQAIKMTSPSSSQDKAPSSPAVQDALQKAKEARAKYGDHSPEAKLAWETLEEIASQESHKKDLEEAINYDEECYVDSAMEVCKTIEELKMKLGRSL
ncbi:hypothetical protein FisN_20Hh129 [Fistulifera solaris]|jgi:hypothetical protein|uniref:CP12 domain-containing protein n=1 Tax=Fistulifera solaris TaxID=1519565 RepID=A0A1Z5KCS2_FISSO|nr:hypothetical protein FisN_20Hh129 [Fistulifera solaris]|eukprot:GAX23922.1 hypothetical protein FisN_20Hh129 [Fistulifera solaris]